MQMYFSTVVRMAPVNEGGELVHFDWDKKQILNRVPIFPDNPEVDDPNPRGNARGGRGIALMGDKVVAASYHTLKVFDRELNHIRDLTHGNMVGLHEISAEGNHVWVSSTAIDAAIAYDIDSGEVVKEFWPREMPAFKKALQLDELKIDRQADNRLRFLERRHLENKCHLHLNAVTPWNGEVYSFFHAFGAVANLDTGKVIFQDSNLRRGHNLVIRDDGIAMVNDTFGPNVRCYDLSSGKQVQVVELGGRKEIVSLVRIQDRIRHQLSTFLKKAKLNRLLPSATPHFVRGMQLVGDRLFVGISPATILCIDLASGEIVDHYQFSRDVRVAVHGLKVA